MTGVPAAQSLQPPAVPAHFQTFLAFDFGLKRTGVASGNRMLKSATPQRTIQAEGDARFAQVAERIPVQNYPHGLRLSPDGSLLAVANMKSGTVSLVDPRDPEKVEHVPVGRGPVQVAFDPSGRTLVVSLNSENKIAIVDVASRKVSRTADVGRGPVQVFVTPDGKTALVANQGSAARGSFMMRRLKPRLNCTEAIISSRSGEAGRRPRMSRSFSISVSASALRPRSPRAPG